MGIQKITQFTTKILSNVKKMPLPKQLSLAALATTGIFGLGIVTGQLLFGDRFEKKTTQNNNPETAELVATNEPTPAIEEEKKELKKLEYSRPTGPDIEADTIAWYVGGEPAEIEYSRNGKPFEIECLESDGSYGGKAKVNVSGKTRYERHQNAYGGHNYTVEVLEDGTRISTFDGLSNWQVEYKQQNPDYIDSNCTRLIKKDDKYITEEFEDYIDPQRKRRELVERFDYKTGNYELEQEKIYDNTGLLKYTVNPKYNKDGDLIKRDTIWVNK